MDFQLGENLFFLGLLIVAFGPSWSCYYRTKNAAVLINPFKLLANYSKTEVLIHLTGFALGILGVVLIATR